MANALKDWKSDQTVLGGRVDRKHSIVTTENSKRISERLRLVRKDGEGTVDRMMKVTGLKRIRLVIHTD